jgi:molecular chaperone GrpE
VAPFSDEQRGNSGVTPVSSAPQASAEETTATPEGDAGFAGDSATSEATPAGEPEAPVTPTGPAEGDGDAEPEPEEPEPEQPEHDDHETKLEHDLEELSAKAQKADEYLELAQRTRADFENYRKRAARDAAAAQERGVVKVVRELLPAVDNLDRALDAVATSDGSSNGDELVSGIKLVHAELIAALARAGVERFDPEGERFDPECHEAVGQQQVEGAESGTIVEVYQRGYRLGEAVIRPARVLVAG